jgi:hypothetical protein
MNVQARRVRPLRGPRLLAGALALLLAQACLADIELSTPDGRRVLLKDDGTWRYQDAAKDAANTPAKPKQEGEAVLTLLQKVERGNHCRVVVEMVNNLPYEIRSLIPYLSAYRANGAMHETQSIAFHSIRPSDRLSRSVDFNRITCSEIARVQVTGGDRCEMGDLNRFSDVKGQCLALVKVIPSELAKFDK